MADLLLHCVLFTGSMQMLPVGFALFCKSTEFLSGATRPEGPFSTLIWQQPASSAHISEYDTRFHSLSRRVTIIGFRACQSCYWLADLRL